jgi:hypothetical protein
MEDSKPVDDPNMGFTDSGGDSKRDGRFEAKAGEVCFEGLEKE